MDGVGDGKLGMITAFCRSDQAKVEPLDALLILVQWDSPEPGVVVVKVFTHPIFCGGPSAPPPGCNHPFSRHFNHPIPTCPAAPVQVAPLFSHSDHPSTRERGRLAKNLLSPHGDMVGELRRGASFVPALPLSVPMISSHSNRDASLQTEAVLGFSVAFRQLQEATQDKA